MIAAVLQWLALRILDYLPVPRLELVYRRAREMCESQPVGLSLHGRSSVTKLCGQLLDYGEYSYAMETELPIGETSHIWVDGYRIDDPVSMVYYASSRSRLLPRDPEFAAHIMSVFAELQRTEDVAEFVGRYMGDMWMLDADAPSVLDLACAQALQADLCTDAGKFEQYVAAVNEVFGYSDQS